MLLMVHKLKSIGPSGPDFSVIPVYKALNDVLWCCVVFLRSVNEYTPAKDI